MTNPEHQPHYEARRALPEPHIRIRTKGGTEHWVDACADPEVLRAELADGQLVGSDGFGTFTLYLDEDAETISRVARGIQEHGEAFAAWAQLHDADPGMLATFTDHYLARYDSLADFGQNLVAAIGWDSTIDLPDVLAPYVSVDYEAVARDELARGTILGLPTANGGIHIFWGADGAQPHGDA